jgi:hypothetical protein
MTNQKYNGWTNRETWLVTLYFSETLQDDMKECLHMYDGETPTENDLKYQIAGMLETCFENYLDEELEYLSNFIKDYLDFSLINWIELAENYLSDF